MDIIKLKKCKVYVDSHILFEGCLYSVPSSYIGRSVTVKKDKDKILILFSNECIRVHSLESRSSKRITLMSDLPQFENIRDYEPVNMVLYQSRLIGENAYFSVLRILRRKPNPLLSYRRAVSIIYLAEKYGCELIEEVLEFLLPSGKINYLRIKQWAEFHLRYRSQKEKIY